MNTESITTLLTSLPGHIGLYLRDTVTGETIAHRADDPIEAASVIKLPIMAEAFRQFECGELDPTEPVTIRPEDKLPSCGALSYLHTGLEVTLMDLAVLMIILSDNTATNLLIRRLGMDKINAAIQGMGMTVTCLRRLLFDGEAAARGIKNTISPEEIGQLLAALYRGEVVSPSSSARMIQILSDQRLNGKIPFWLDGKVKCAHKTGEDSNITHDAAIIYAPRPFVLCIFGDPVDPPALNQLMGKIAGELAREHGAEMPVCFL